MKGRIQMMILALAVILVAAPTTALGNTSTAGRPDTLSEKVRHELVMLPFYNVFDNLTYRVEGDVVTLGGQVSRPTLKSDAENVVRRIAGVRQVKNEIEVLPLSSFDNRIRLGVLRAIYSQPALNRYALGSIPGIHIIVKNGSVTLEGVVANAMDRNIAFLAANGVPGVFSVTNNLQLEKRS